MACQTCQYFINKLFFFFFGVLKQHLFFSSLEGKWGPLSHIKLKQSESESIKLKQSSSVHC